MDLERHLRVLWRHRAIVIGGLVLGVVTAFLAAFQVGTDGIKRRGFEEWTSTSMVLVTQPGFPEGRVTLPMTNVPGATQDPADALPEPESGKGRLAFADPSRFSNLALLYSVISHSDRVRRILPGHPSPDQIRATPFDPTGRGDQFLPVIQITTTAATQQAAYDLNRNTVKGLRALLVREQRANEIGDNERVRLQLLNAPSPAVLLAGRSMTSSILAFVLCLAAAFALAHLVEGLGKLRGRKAAEEPQPEPMSFDELELDLGLAPSNGSSNGRHEEVEEVEGAAPARTSRRKASRSGA
jgi:hypothetical protein